MNGKLYNVPMNFHEITINGAVVRGDLMKKYAIGDIKTLEDYGKYLDAIKKNEPNMVPYDAGADGNRLSTVHSRATGYLGNFDPVANVTTKDFKKAFDVFEQKPKLEFFNLMHTWNENGYWSKNALVKKETAKDSFSAGKSASFVENLLAANAAYMKLNVAHPEWDVKYYPFNPNVPYTANPYINNGMAINAKSKNAERALMFLDLLRNDKEYNLLTTYGIKGKHYDLSPEGKLIALPDAQNFPADGACPWGWRDDRFYLTANGGLPNYNQILDNARKNLIATPINNFVFDNTTVKSQKANLDSIISQYVGPLNFGVTSSTVEQDWNNNVVAKLKTAGVDTYLQEYQKQLDAYLANLK
ncbi:ABC transporter substrate-binding protein [Paenibacillus roseipurpureus]|uniref:ABC transporter substrate-binding protein n=1 Tax=Paenibacillus roseopurpureus TaxID=2918901 RepID=A0AA96LJP2_9BACL|nr:ABC transporter substrate-binding protein [Paenibacillus sp. MBLB1832]WNR42990.1 ABC transporter substrate-binding protein [Paenibacillus sp. MBLB1832]